MPGSDKSDESPPAVTPDEPTNQPADGAANAADTAAQPSDPLSLAEDRANKAEAEKKDTHDRMLRVAADFENFKKRTRKDLEEAESRGRRGLLTAVLPIIDNLERAVDAAGAGDAKAGGIAEGVRLVLKQCTQVLEKFEVRALQALGEAFDPSVHEAIQQVETADAPPGTVVKELQKGYTIAGKLLRPAMVAVAKALPTAPEPAKSDESSDAEAPAAVVTPEAS